MAGAVFVGHSREDALVAGRIVDLLEERGVECWFAPRDARAGEDATFETVDAVDAASAVVAVLSGSANRSPLLRNVLERAVERQKSVVRFYVEQFAPTLELLPFLSGGRSIDAVGGPLERHVDALAAALRGGPQAPSVARAAPPRAEPPRPRRQGSGRIAKLVRAAAPIAIIALAGGALGLLQTTSGDITTAPPDWYDVPVAEGTQAGPPVAETPFVTDEPFATEEPVASDAPVEPGTTPEPSAHAFVHISIDADNVDGQRLMEVFPGDVIAVSAGGIWCLSDGSCGGPEGIRDPTADEEPLLLPGAPAGALIARAGSSDWVVVGQTLTWSPTEPGTLELSFNGPVDRGRWPGQTGAVWVEMTIGTER